MLLSTSVFLGAMVTDLTYNQKEYGIQCIREMLTAWHTVYKGDATSMAYSV